MEIELITSLISTLGFPIVLVLAMGWFIYKLQQESVDRENKLYDIIRDYGTKIESITTTLERVVVKLDVLSGEVSELKHQGEE